ncbi:DUF6894 family protein [Methylobacterium nigriterrae]|uniref:DUF6894 family protein n=1 Tax=Methylobacterium nigriterrae TaxID=3127512 RepID=UPI0030139EEE
MADTIQRFHFDLIGDETVLTDEVGVVAGNLDEALAEALEAINILQDSGELAEIDFGWQMAVRDESGLIRKTFAIR